MTSKETYKNGNSLACLRNHMMPVPIPRCSTVICAYMPYIYILASALQNHNKTYTHLLYAHEYMYVHIHVEHMHICSIHMHICSIRIHVCTYTRRVYQSIISDDVLTNLLTFPNVIITAHQSFLTAEALQVLCLYAYMHKYIYTYAYIHKQ